MSIVKTALLAIAIAVTTAAPAVHAQQSAVSPDPATPSAASGFVLDIGKRAVAMLAQKSLDPQERTGRLRDMLRSGFDLDFIGRFAMGRHWRRATEEQRASYQRLFAEYVVRTYAGRLETYSGETFDVLTERPAGERDTVVRTRIAKPGGGKPLTADWRVRDYGDSHRIVDIAVEGISMAVTQRQEFDAVVRRFGVSGLIARLQARIGQAALSSGTAHN